jgi:hypothetical protein
LAAERQKRWAASHNASSNASSNAIVRDFTDEHRRLAREAGVDCATEWAKYRDWQATLPAAKRHRNQGAGFNNWLRRAEQFKFKASRSDLRAKTMDGILGRDRHERRNDERDITGEAERIA